MPTALRLNDEQLEQLQENLRALYDQVNKGSSTQDLLDDWAPEIRRAWWALNDAVGDARVERDLRAVRRPRDSQRSKMYRAEHAVDHERPRITGPAAQRQWLVTNVLSQHWFRAWFRDIAPESVHISVSETRNTSYYRHIPASNSRPAPTHHLAYVPNPPDLTLLHELAHACHRVWYGGGREAGASHDANFAGILVALVTMALGREVGIKLARSLDTAGVKATPITKQQRTTQCVRPADPILSIAQRSAK